MSGKEPGSGTRHVNRVRKLRRLHKPATKMNSRSIDL